MSVKLLTEHHLEFLSLKGGYTGLSESTLVKIFDCWKSHVMAQLYLVLIYCHYSGVSLFSTWINRPSIESMLFKKNILSTKTNDVGTQKNSLNEHPKHVQTGG